MSRIVRELRYTASRIFKRRSNDEERELGFLGEVEKLYNSTCFSIHQACTIGDEQAVRWYLAHEPDKINEPDKNGRVPIFYAIHLNNIAVVRLLINGGADVDIISTLSEGVNSTAGLMAARFNRVECLKLLIEHGAKINTPNNFGGTPLHVACRDKFKDTVKLLIDCGKADVNVMDNDNATPLHMVASRANEEGRLAVAEILLDNGANPFIEDHDGSTVFHEASENNAYDLLKLMIEHRNTKAFNSNGLHGIADVLNKRTKDGYNCLHIAVKNGWEKVIQICIDHKADINMKTSQGDTSLHLACEQGHLQACKLLLDNGADLHVTDKMGRHTMQRAAIKGHLDCMSYLLEKSSRDKNFKACGSVLIAASFNRNSEAVKFLLEAGTVPTSVSNLKDTCLHVAVRNGDLKTVKVILEHCAEDVLELKDKNERTALHLAAKNGNVEVMKLLLSYNPNYKAKEQNCKWPIHVASEYGNTECARLLLDISKCSVYARDFLWRTPLHIMNSAAKPGEKDLDVTRLLLDCGSDPNARDDRRWTPLFYVAFGGCMCSTEILVKSGANINDWDKNKMTALHIAASQNNVNACRTLLKYGADPSILNCEGLGCMDIALMNRYHDVCMEIANSDRWRESIVSVATMETCLTTSPEVAKVILDKCVETTGREIDADYKITYNFELLDPHPDESDSYYGPMVMTLFRRNALLTHPLTKQLLTTNWANGVRFMYYISMAVIALALLFVIVFISFNKRIAIECYHFHEIHNFTGVPKEFFTTEHYCTDKSEYNHERMFYSRCLILVFFTLYLLNELKQLYNERWMYFTDILNVFDIFVSSTFIYLVQIPSTDPIPFNRFVAGIVGVFAHCFLFFLWTRGLSRFGILIMMFLEVLATLLRVLFAFSFLLLGFSVTFYLMFFDDKDFMSVGNSLLKVMAMMLGDLDYEAFRQSATVNTTKEVTAIAIFVFFVFCFTIALVANNLLIGLAVGDIESVQKNAEIKLLSLQVNQIVDARNSMPAMLRRRCYHQTLTVKPNYKQAKCDEEKAEAKQYKKRNEKAKEKKKRESSVFESMVDMSLLTSDVKT